MYIKIMHNIFRKLVLHLKHFNFHSKSFFCKCLGSKWFPFLSGDDGEIFCGTKAEVHNTLNISVGYEVPRVNTNEAG